MLNFTYSVIRVSRGTRQINRNYKISNIAEKTLKPVYSIINKRRVLFVCGGGGRRKKK